MAPVKTTHSNELIRKRLHEMRLSASEIARAEASFRNAEALVDAGFRVVAAVRAAPAYAARRLRAAFVSPLPSGPRE